MSQIKPVPTIVFVHGFVDFFTIIKRFTHNLGYWRDIPQTIARVYKTNVLVPIMTSGASPIQMAEELKGCLRHLLTATLGGPVYFIADSMGGLTVRFLLSKHGLDCASSFNVLGIATVGTPHHGTAIADILLGQDCHEKILVSAFEKLGFDGLSHMTTESLKKFNDTYTDCPVKIFSYGGSIRNSLRQIVFPPLLVTSYILNSHEGENDGLVSVNSAKWGTYIETIKADHAAQIGHFLGPEYFDYKSFYLQVAKKLLETT